MKTLRIISEKFHPSYLFMEGHRILLLQWNDDHRQGDRHSADRADGGHAPIYARSRGKGKREKRKFYSLFFTLPFALFIGHGSSASDIPSMAAPPPDTSMSASMATSSNDVVLEEGKALYANGQYLAALSKFMLVLRRDPHQPEARQYLRLVVNQMRKNANAPAPGALTTPEGGTIIPERLVAEEVRQRIHQRQLLTMDLRAIPGVKVEASNNAIRVILDTSLLFTDKTSGLKEQSIPMLDRVAAWLKTFGRQMIIIHCYPEENQDPSTNGSLFLHRYAEIYSFFVDERKLSPSRFVSADLLNNPSGHASDVTEPSAASSAKSISSPTSAGTSAASRIVIETLGNSSSDFEALLDNTRGHTDRWLECFILSSRDVFYPEEGEWASLQISALTRLGLSAWSFQIFPALDKGKNPVFTLQGKQNVLTLVSWDGRNQKTGDLVPAGSYIGRLTATDLNGTRRIKEASLEVKISLSEAGPVKAVHTPKHHHAKHKPAAAHSGGKRAASVSTGESPDVQSSAASSSAMSPDAGAESSPASSTQGSAVHAIWKQVIQFDAGQSDLKPTVKSSLERIGKTLDVYPLQKVRIMGYADPSEPNAATLAKKRAETIQTILITDYQVPASRVIVAGGEVGTDASARKVEISITN